MWGIDIGVTHGRAWLCHSPYVCESIPPHPYLLYTATEGYRTIWDNENIMGSMKKY
jgi:hypothetical protein